VGHIVQRLYIQNDIISLEKLEELLKNGQTLLCKDSAPKMTSSNTLIFQPLPLQTYVTFHHPITGQQQGNYVILDVEPLHNMSHLLLVVPGVFFPRGIFKRVKSNKPTRK